MSARQAIDPARRALVFPASRRQAPPRPRHRSYDQGRGLRPAAFVVAVLIQLALAIALLRPTTAPPPPGDHTVQVVLLPTPEHPPDPPTPAPPPPTLAPAPLVMPAPPVIQINEPKPLLPASAPPAPSAITMPAPAPPPPPPAAAPGIEDAFKSAVRAAVFAAHRVPEAARLLAQFGETRVGFTLLDGAVSNVRIVASSGHESLDNAALAAVRNAQYPAVPEALRGRLLSFEITLYHRRGDP